MPRAELADAPLRVSGTGVQEGPGPAEPTAQPSGAVKNAQELDGKESMEAQTLYPGYHTDPRRKPQALNIIYTHQALTTSLTS